MNSPEAAPLAAAFPAPVVVTIADRRIEIQKAGVRHCTLVHQRAMVLIVMMEEDTDELTFIDEHPVETNELIAFALDLPQDWVASLAADHKLDLALAWVKVNTAFFVQRLLPARNRLQVAIAELSGAGPTPSNTSAPADIPTPTTTHPRVLNYGLQSPSVTNGAGAPTP